MAYIAELQIKVDTTQLDQAKKSLDDLSKISPNVENSTKRVAKEFDDAASSADGYTAAQRRLIERAKEQVATFGKSRDETLLYKASLLGVKDQVAPLVTELQRLKQAKLDEANAGDKSGGNVSKRQAEKQALAEQAQELERIIALERERVRAQNVSIGAVDPDTSRTREAEAALGSYEQKLNAVRSQEASLGGEIRTTREELSKQAVSYRGLVASIDPATEAVRRLDEQQDALNAAFERGRRGSGPVISTAEYERLNGIIETSRKRIGDLGATTGKTAKEINFALRGLPAQFTDIVVSLQGGQDPFTVFLQQGGQIKDSFGGAIPALRELAKFTLGLITPFTLAAAAIAGVTAGFVIGGREAQNFNRALQQTGNASGLTVNSFTQLTRTLDDSITTSGKAAKVLTEIAASGKITEASFDRVARAAIAWEKATGQATEETVKAFASLRGDPVNAVEELNKSYNFLTASVYDQIASLQEQGRTQEATILAEKALADAFEERAEKVRNNLGLIEEAWNFVATAAKEGWDAILDIGRQVSPQDQLAATFKLIADYEAAGQIDSGTYRELIANVERLQNEIASAEEKAFNKRIDLQVENEAIAARSALARRLADARTNAEKEKAELAKLDKEIAQAARKGITYTEEEIGKLRADIRKKYEDKQSTGRVDTVRETAAQRLLATYKQQEAALISQRDSTVKQGTEAQKLAKLQQQIADIELKAKTEKLTKEQESLLANKDILISQLQTNVGVEAEIKAREQVNRLKGISISLDQQLLNDQQRYSDALVGAGMSDRQAERLRERNKLEQDYQKQLADAGTRLSNGDITDDTFTQETELYKQSLDERLAAQEAFYAAEDEARGNWLNGAEKAFANYIEAGSDVAGLTETFFTNSFNTIEGVLVDFVTTGKASFKDLAVSILADLAKVAAKAAIVSAITAAFGGGGGAGGALSAIFQADGGAWSGGTQFFAKGGAFTNSVVSKPTAFGTGTGLGVMGEAGPEAILPLTRTSDGQLGVQSMGGGNTVVAPVSVTLNTDGGSNAASGSSSDNESQGRAVQQAVKRECEMAIQTALRPGGSIFRAMNGR